MRLRNIGRMKTFISDAAFTKTTFQVHHSLNKCSALRAAIEKEVNQPNRNKLVLLTKAKVCAHISSGSGEARLLVVVR
jgi:hypothetical protein